MSSPSETNVLAIPQLRDRFALVIHPQEYILSTQIYAKHQDFDRAVDEIVRLKTKARLHPQFAGFAQSLNPMEANYRCLWASQLQQIGDSGAAKEQADAATALYGGVHACKIGN